MNEIAISSMIFSLISIIVTIISMITKTQILDSQGYAAVKFCVTGSVSNKLDECRNKTKKIAERVSDALGLDKELIEVQRPKKIPYGLQMRFEIHLNHIKSRDINYEKELINLYENGALAEILKKSWDLEIVPEISSFEFKVNESKNRQKGAVTIKVNSNSIDKFPQNIGTITALPVQPKVKITDIGTSGRDIDGINDDDDDDAESGSDDIVYTNQIVINGEIDNDNNRYGEEYDSKEDKEKVNKLNDKQKNVVELYKIEGVMDNMNYETAEGGLKYIGHRQESTPL